MMSILYTVLSLLLITSGAIAQAGQGCICTASFDPVCGKDDQNYSNECQAKCAEVEVAYKGNCLSKGCICSEEYKPVCGKDDRVYTNRCVADCIGAEVASEGECPIKGCKCKKEYKLVCGTNGRTYSNECFAICDKTGIESEGKCPPMDGTELDPEACVANCPDEDVPVCGTDGKTYTNGCLAVCSNVEVARSGECASNEQLLPALSLPGCICTMEYRPVCGSDNATYDNPCLARCAKVDVVNEGLCGSASPELPQISGPGCGTNMCPAVFAPVCDTNGKTHSNECVAKCSGAEVAHLGPCVDPKTTCECSGEQATVCGADGVTYPNECLATCNKISVASVGACPQVCACPLIFSPVCGKDGKTYGNKCAADCQGVAVDSEGACYQDLLTSGNASSPSVANITVSNTNADNSTVAGTSVDCSAVSCPTDGTPVCGKDGKTYPNECLATCSGTTVEQEGPCPAPKCGFGACAEYGFSPVCGKDKKTYPNECQARCSGTEVAADGNCDRCLCTMEYKPVCGEDGITYPNSCEAKCLETTVKAPGKCQRDCICTDEFKPVCGINGITFSNECEAKCAEVGKAYDGPCETENIPETLCTCSKELFPVCGKDGITYDNKCLIKCANATMAYEGMCKEVQLASAPEGSDLPGSPAGDAIKDVQFGPQALKTDAAAPSCICTKEYMPVCGKNSKTYSNKCMAKCAGTKVAYNGTCACKCTKEFKPVCATDGKTYSNPCQAQCKGEKAAYEGLCKRAERGPIPCGPSVPVARCPVDPCKGKKCKGAVCLSFRCTKPVLFQGVELKEACTPVFVTRKAGVLVRGACP